MISNKHIKIAVFLAIFLNVCVGQIPLDIRNNSIVGIGGIIINETTLNKASEMFGRHPHAISNFQLMNPKDKDKVYEAWQQSDMMSCLWMIVVNKNIVKVVMVKTFMDDENVLRGVHKVFSQKRKARLGYPATELTSMLIWLYPNSSYMLALHRTDTGVLQIIETVGTSVK